MMQCFSCGKELDSYDTGAYRKFVNKCAKRFLCRDCLAEDLGWTREYLESAILRCREQGCLLFPPIDWQPPV